MFFNVQANGQTGGENDLFILNDDVFLNKNNTYNAKAVADLVGENATGKQKGAIEIDNFFTAGQDLKAAAEGDYKGAGYMTVNAGAAKIVTRDVVNAIASEVVAWLDNNANYASAMDVINSGNTADIQSLMVCYAQA